MNIINNIESSNIYTKGKLKLSVKGIIYFFKILLLTCIGEFFINTLKNNEISYDVISKCGLITITIIIIEYLIFFNYTKKNFSNYAIFMISFIIFNFGLFLVFCIGGTYNFFYLKLYEKSTILKTMQYEFLCTGALFLSGAWISRIKSIRFKNINSISKYTIYKIAIFFLCITGLVSFLLLILKFKAFTIGYYDGVRKFETRIPSVISLMEYLFMPFAILTLIYSEKAKTDKFVEMMVIIWSLITALLGDRTSGIAGILIIMIIKMRFKSNEKKVLKKYIIGILAIITSTFLIVFIKSFREGIAFSTVGILSIFSEVLGELGSSFFPLTLIIRICPKKYSFLYGKSYIYSILSGIIPASIDPTGTISEWNSKSIEPLNWISSEYNFTFGTGYSLCAEAYANFGYCGFIALFVVGLIIIKLLAIDSNNIFSKYSSTILLFEFFTLPRRNVYYIFNHFFYCIIIVSLIIFLLRKNKNINE